MGASKRWRIVADTATEFPSEAAAYGFVETLREKWLDGTAGGSATLQVHEGHGWQSVELIDFAEEAS